MTVMCFFAFACDCLANDLEESKAYDDVAGVSHEMLI